MHLRNSASSTVYGNHEKVIESECYQDGVPNSSNHDHPADGHGEASCRFVQTLHVQVRAKHAYAIIHTAVCFHSLEALSVGAQSQKVRWGDGRLHMSATIADGEEQDNLMVIVEEEGSM